MTEPTPNSTSPSLETPDPAVTRSASRGFGARFEPPADSVLRLPATCANCSAPAGSSARLHAPWGVKGRPVLVPYCARCAQRLEQYRTRNAVALGASFLVGLVLLLGLPLVPARLTMFTYGAIVVVGAAAPQVVVWLVGRRRGPEPGQTAAEVALWWDKGGMGGSNSTWMAEFASLNPTPSHPNVSDQSGTGAAMKTPRSGPAPGDSTFGHAVVIPLTGPRPLGWHGWVLPLTFAAISPSLFQWLFPTLIVLNLSPSEFDLFVDGRNRGVVGVTSLESASAATRIPLGAGPHVLEARPRGEGVEAAPSIYGANVALEAGNEYVFAPGSEGYCFWLERTTYGSAGGKSRTQPLGGKDGFFRLPSPIDTWFGANPQPNADRLSTGGEMVALRQGRCR